MYIHPRTIVPIVNQILAQPGKRTRIIMENVTWRLGVLSSEACATWTLGISRLEAHRTGVVVDREIHSHVSSVAA